MIRLASAWAWDFWFADDGDQYHIFFLKASRALIDPDRRHWRANIGHAVSTDLTTWHEVADALVPADPGAWDDLATWTGSVVRDDSGQWRMFYTGVDREGKGLIQRIGYVVSDDLMVWRRPEAAVPLESDGRFYEKFEQGSWPDEAWRDPWVFKDESENGWHMLVTARANDGEPDKRGVIGHAWSSDLDEWQVRPPVSRAGSEFGQLEVAQVESVDGRLVLLFSCLDAELSAERRAAGERGGIWAVNITSPTGPFDIDSAYRVADQELYSGRLIRRRSGQWAMLAFRHTLASGEFIGEIIDPIDVGWVGDRLVLLDDSAVAVTRPGATGALL